MKKLLLLVVLVLYAGTAAAEEGMWTMDQLGMLDLQSKGLRVNAEDVYTPGESCLADAAVLLGGGSSAFVSPNGLLLTNHHVAFGAVQRASTQGTDYLTDGFLARSYSEEIQAPGVSAQIIIEMRDVTEEVLKAATGKKDLVKRQRAIDEKIQKMTDKIEKGADDISARVAAMYNGAEYKLYVYKRFDDVRIVYMPPLAIGNYGGEIDNWMWPRHTGDFAFARVYCSPDGEGRKYDEDNIPYRPRTWLQVSTSDLDEGDFAFSLGFPGSTTRYRTSHSASYWHELFLPKMLKQFDDQLAALDMVAGDSPEAQMRVLGMKKGLQNVQKNWGGMLASMNKYNFVDEKRAEEAAVQAFVDADPKLKSEYGSVLNDIEQLYVDVRARKDHSDALDMFGGRGSVIAGVAGTAVYFAKEREKPKSKRDPFFSEEDVERILFRMDSRYMEYFEPAERWSLKYALENAAELPDDKRIVGLNYILKDSARSIDEWVDHIISNTKLDDKEYAKTLFDKSSKELAALDDPLINLGLAIYDEADAQREADEEFGAKINVLRKKFNEARKLWKGGVMYPDANRTLRFSGGTIKGYRPKDAVTYYPFTKLEGVLDKDTGEQPFNMPDKLKKLYLEKNFGRWADPELGDVPVAFLVNCDGTGGSSGSPVLNGKGEMIGIAFDGVIESRLGDWKYVPEVTREICVDMRYVLFVTEKYAGAGFLLEELGVKAGDS
jgi:hypothetical protein